MAKAQAAVSESAIMMCATSLPGAAQMLGVKCPGRRSVPSETLIRVALTPRVRGSGPAVEQCRAVQNSAVAVVARCALAAQERGFNLWLDRRGASASSDVPMMRGCSAMWDEAAKARWGHPHPRPHPSPTARFPPRVGRTSLFPMPDPLRRAHIHFVVFF